MNTLILTARSADAAFTARTMRRQPVNGNFKINYAGIRAALRFFVSKPQACNA